MNPDDIIDNLTYGLGSLPKPKPKPKTATEVRAVSTDPFSIYLTDVHVETRNSFVDYPTINGDVVRDVVSGRETEVTVRGMVIGETDATAMIGLRRGSRLLLITDEQYDNLRRDGLHIQRDASLINQLNEARRLNSEVEADRINAVKDAMDARDEVQELRKQLEAAQEALEVEKARPSTIRVYEPRF